MDWIGALLGEVRLAVSDPRIWVGSIEAVVVFAIATLLGRSVARGAGLLGADSTEAERTAVGLAVGLSVLAALWATIVSGGRSAFSPVAISYLVCIALVVIARSRGSSESTETTEDLRSRMTSNWRQRLVVAGFSVGFIVLATVLYGSTMALMARDGVQPLEFFDEAFYSILGRDVGLSGVESFYSPAGFEALPDTPDQSWYHWGEAWLVALVIRVFGATAIDARHFVILPVLLLAAASVTGCVVRVLCQTKSTKAFIAGGVVCLFLAPIPFATGPIHAAWAVGMVFGITLYGSAAVAGILCVYAVGALPQLRSSWGLAGLIATCAVFLLPAHLIVAILAAVGALAAAAWYWVVRALAGSRVRIPPIWWQTGVWALTLALLTVGWGTLTGHGIAASAPSSGVSPFGPVWRVSILAVLVGSLALLTVPIAAVRLWRDDPRLSALAAGACALLGAGAAAWGARLADFNMFHVFFAGLAVFVTPIAAATIWTFWTRARASGNRMVAVALVVILLAQVEVGAASTVFRLQRFGPGDFEAIPTAILDAIRVLPADAKIAYPCQPLEEHSVWDPRLAGIDAHTGRRVITMCFQADAVGQMVGAPIDPSIEAPFFRFAPQRVLYPSDAFDPSPEAVKAFLAANGIRYLYTDPYHTGRLLPEDVEIIRVGPFRLARVP